jgi:nucleotide-binding universal stress UspA family protein
MSIKILVCLDGSSFAEQILPYVTELSTRFQSKVVLLQVFSIPSAVSVTGGEAGLTEALTGQFQAAENDAKSYLARVAQPLRESGLDVECVVLPGPPGPAIVRYANEDKIGLIAIATHGRSGLGRLVFGNVADFVLRGSGLPILLMKPKIPARSGAQRVKDKVAISRRKQGVASS